MTDCGVFERLWSVVGRDAKIQAALAMVIPDRMRDWLIAQQLGLPKRA